MHFFYLVGKLYPYWAIPIVIILMEVGIYFKRKNHKAQYFCWGTAVLLALGILLWLFFRGDLYSDHWLQVLLNLGL